MVITEAHTVNVPNPCGFAWSQLRRFHSVNYTKSVLISLHQIPKKHHSNARKQAEQIRYCLMQAKEYFDASEVVTLATRPVLLYYSIMYLALAEILLKQSGESNLEFARDQHRHHGLQIGVGQSLSPDLPLEHSANALVACPMLSAAKGGGFGTFALYHKSARELPLLGRWNSEIVSQEGYRALLGPHDGRLAELPKGGVTLLNCLKNLPSMYGFLRFHGVTPNLVRGKLEVVDKRNNTRVCTLTIHPSTKALLDSLYERIKISPSAFEQFHPQELHSGCILRFTLHSGVSDSFQLPVACSYRPDEIFFAAEDVALNEFGTFYVALFIAGSFARYYPDKWMRDIDAASPLGLAVEALASQFNERVPLLALSELQRELLVNE